MNFIGALSFYDSKREMKRVKFGVILVLNKSEERSEKRVVFVLTAVFERARNWCVKNFSLSVQKFFCARAAFKSSFFATFDSYEVYYDIVLVLDLFWQELKVSSS